MRAITDTMSKQNTAPSKGDDVTANHIPCPTEPKIVCRRKRNPPALFTATGALYETPTSTA
jgi:hypothetical protein